MQMCIKKENKYLKNRLSCSVFEEGYIRKPLILGKARPKQFFSSQSQVSYFLALSVFLRKSRLLSYPTLEKSPSLPKFRENSDSICSGLGYGAVGLFV